MGWEIEFDKSLHNDVPTVDRINSRKGYEKDNVAILCWRCNSIKKDASILDIQNIWSVLMKFKIILADPPWNWKTWSDKGREKSPPYHCMSMSDIQSLPVQDISDNDSVLFMWATYPLLHEVIHTVESWGFHYTSVAFTWVKKSFPSQGGKYFVGCGYYTRANPEICLLGTKKKKLKRLNRSVRNLIVDPRDPKHSRKPICVHHKIVELFGDLPRIELFATQKTDGWTCLGDEIDGKDIKWAIKELVIQ